MCRFFDPPAIADPTNQEQIMDQNPFEIPQQMRDLAQKNIEQASAVYGQFMDAMTQAMGIWSKTMPANEMASGFKGVQDLAVKFAKQNAETGFALASDLAKAKDMQEVLALQGRYVQAQMQAHARQAQELGQFIAQAAQSIRPRG
jgi:hypothetical protein